MNTMISLDVAASLIIVAWAAGAACGIALVAYYDRKGGNDK